MIVNKKLIRRKRGFTLIEILIVLGVIGVLISILFVSLGDNKQTIDQDTNNIKMQTAKLQIESALYRFKNHFGRLPTTEEGLSVLFEPSPGTEEEYPERPFIVNKKRLLDPWNMIYQYKFHEDTGQYQIFTFGADRKEGGQGAAKDSDLATIQ